MAGLGVSVNYGCNLDVANGCRGYTVLSGATEVRRTTDASTDAINVLYSSVQTSDSSQCGVTNKNCLFRDAAPAPLANGTTVTVLIENDGAARTTCIIGDGGESLYKYWLYGNIAMYTGIGVFCAGIVGVFYAICTERVKD